MIKKAFVISLIFFWNYSFAQIILERRSLPKYATFWESFSTDSLNKRITIQFLNDTIIFSTKILDIDKDTSYHNSVSILPLKNIKDIQIRSTTENSVSIVFESMSRRSEFIKTLPDEQKTFDIPMVLISSENLKDSILFKDLKARIEPYLFEYIPDCSVVDTVYHNDGLFVQGIYNDKLVEQAQLNNRTNIEVEIERIFKDSLPEMSSKKRFKFIYITLLISQTDSISEGYIANYSMYLYRKSLNPSFVIDDNKHSHENGGFINGEENTRILNLLKTQTWKAGICNGNKVDTIIQMNVSL